MLYCDTYLLISYYHIGFSGTYAVFFGMTSSVRRRPCHAAGTSAV